MSVVDVTIVRDLLASAADTPDPAERLRLTGRARELWRGEPLGEFAGIEEGQPVKRTGEVLSVPVGDAFMGRVVNPLGQPIDGMGDIPATERRALEILDAKDSWTKVEIRKQYKSLVKDLHPDMNGGDRSDEERLQQVVWAWDQIKDSRSFRDE